MFWNITGRYLTNITIRYYSKVVVIYMLKIHVNLRRKDTSVTQAL